jgi:hypothetical protein
MVEPVAIKGRIRRGELPPIRSAIEADLFISSMSYTNRHSQSLLSAAAIGATGAAISRERVGPA